MAQGQGRCVTNDQKCEGGDFLRNASGKPVISGWNFFALATYFDARDNLRQQVIDLAQLERVIASTSTGNLSSLASASFDPLKLGFLGQGVGSIEGALFNAVSPRTTRVALNTPAGGWVQLIMTSPDPKFTAARTALIAELAQLGAAPGTPAFDQNLGVIQWVFDAADPASVGYRLTHGVSVTQGQVTYTAPNAGRVAFLQFIEGDQVFPTLSTLALVTSANRSSFAPTPPSYGCTSPLLCYEFTEAGALAFDQTSAPLATRDAFLLLPPAGTPASVGLQITGAAQTQVVTFLATGQLP